jgi:nucleolar protein 58
VLEKNAKTTDFSEILPEEVEEALKEQAEVSMGTEIAEEDIDNIQQLCDQVINIGNYRTSLFEYLKNRMAAIAPNLSVMVGELVGARLIAHAGSLLNLAKQPASTVQILGAEKALFRALKTKHDTPKYGLIYHASLVGQAAPKFKGKVSRVLAAKAALATRMDALGDTEGVTVGLHYREKVENRVKGLEGGQIHQLSGTSKGKATQEKYSKPNSNASYNPQADVALETKKKKKERKKRTNSES